VTNKIIVNQSQMFPVIQMVDVWYSETICRSQNPRIVSQNRSALYPGVDGCFHDEVRTYQKTGVFCGIWINPENFLEQFETNYVFKSLWIHE
jgi:hypothetical protein